MANTVQIGGKVQVTAPDGSSVKLNRDITITPTGKRYLYNVQSVGTAAESLAVNDLGTLRYLGLLNPSDSGGTVTVTCASFVLKPGDVLVAPPVDMNVTLQATGAAINTVAAGSEE